MKLFGPDVSFYQDDPFTARGIDFVQMKAAGAKFVIIRAGQNLWEDNEFDISWKASKGVLPRGSYWFYDSRIDPKLQARKWLSAFEDPADIGELPLWCDYEDNYGGAFGRWQDWYDFMETLKVLRPGVKLGVYTGYYYWRERTIAKAIPKASLNYFKQYPLWIAAYNPVGPQVPEPWDDWTLWQFTDNGDGTRYGVESLNIDLNYFNGDAAAFEQFAGSQPDTPPTDPKPPATPDSILRMEVMHKSGKVVVLQDAASLRQELIAQKQYALELDRELQTGDQIK